jgi:hypothetical protein
MRMEYPNKKATRPWVAFIVRNQPLSYWLTDFLTW